MPSEANRPSEFEKRGGYSGSKPGSKMKPPPSAPSGSVAPKIDPKTPPNK